MLDILVPDILVGGQLSVRTFQGQKKNLGFPCADQLHISAKRCIVLAHFVPKKSQFKKKVFVG